MFSLILIHFSHINKNKRKYFFKIVTKVTLYAIWKDTTPPTVVLQPNGGSYIIPSTGTLSIQTKITASDNESGFTTLQYAWSTNQKVRPTTGWTNFSNGQTVTLPGYTDTNYYLWIDVVDKFGNVANNLRVSNAFSVYSIQLKSGPNKTEYENGENVDYTGITVVKHNDVLGDEIIDSSLYTISNSRNDDIANNIRYQITVSYEGYSWNIDTYKKGWYGYYASTYYYYENCKKLTGMHDLYYYTSDLGNTYNTYYFDESGIMQTGWRQFENGKWYYLYEPLDYDKNVASVKLDTQANFESIGAVRGVMIKSFWALIRTVGTDNYYWYYFDANGVMVTGWQQIGGYWYYMTTDGHMQTGWQQIGGSWYFLRQSINQYGTGPAGSMLANTSAYINGKTYYFNASGVCTNP